MYNILFYIIYLYYTLCIIYYTVCIIKELSRFCHVFCFAHLVLPPCFSRFGSTLGFCVYILYILYIIRRQHSTESTSSLGRAVAQSLLFSLSLSLSLSLFALLSPVSFLSLSLSLSLSLFLTCSTAACISLHFCSVRCSRLARIFWMEQI